jgi:hypothetical protein
MFTSAQNQSQNDFFNTSTSPKRLFNETQYEGFGAKSEEFDEDFVSTFYFICIFIFYYQTLIIIYAMLEYYVNDIFSISYENMLAGNECSFFFFFFFNKCNLIFN